METVDSHLEICLKSYTRESDHIDSEYGSEYESEEASDEEETKVEVLPPNKEVKEVKIKLQQVNSNSDDEEFSALLGNDLSEDSETEEEQRFFSDDRR